MTHKCTVFSGPGVFCVSGVPRSPTDPHEPCSPGGRRERGRGDKQVCFLKDRYSRVRENVTESYRMCFASFLLFTLYFIKNKKIVNIVEGPKLINIIFMRVYV